MSYPPTTGKPTFQKELTSLQKYFRAISEPFYYLEPFHECLSVFHVDFKHILIAKRSNVSLNLRVTLRDF